MERTATDDFVYPKREPFFALRFIRMLYATYSAQEIGNDGISLLTILALAEDAIFYSQPTRFWNEQLMSMLGYKSRKQLIACRDRVIAAGWLRYARKNVRSVGLYYVTIPDRFSGVAAKIHQIECTEPETSSGTLPPVECTEPEASSGTSRGTIPGTSLGTPSNPNHTLTSPKRERSYSLPDRYKTDEVANLLPLYVKHWESTNHQPMEQFRLDCLLMEAARSNANAAKLCRWMAKCVSSGKYINWFDPDDGVAEVQAYVPKPVPARRTRSEILAHQHQAAVARGEVPRAATIPFKAAAGA